MRIFNPGWTIEFGDKMEADTDEVLEVFSISYDTLASRIRQSGFPKPLRVGRNGKTALYDVREMLKWAKEHGLTTGGVA